MAQYNLGRVQGLSAYEVAVQNGYIGTEEEWLTWLKAKNGTEVEINSELQPNVNFIGNEKTVESVNGKKFASNTEIITTPTGFTEEERYNELLKSTCKEFTSNGSPIVVNNGIAKQKVLSGKIEGQTVKNYCNTIIGSNLTGNTSVEDSSNTIIINHVLGITNTAEVKTSGMLKPSTEYDIVVIVKQDVNGLLYIYADSGTAFLFAREKVAVTNGIAVITKTTFSDFTDVTRDIKFAILSTDATTDVKFTVMIVDKGLGKYVKSYIPFGLSSTQAIITNNGMKYSFYKDATDKASGTVIALDGGITTETNDTLAILEDGSGILTKNYVSQIINGNTLGLSFVGYSEENKKLVFSKLNEGIKTGWSWAKCNVLNYESKAYYPDLVGYGYHPDANGRTYFAMNSDLFETKDLAGLKKYLNLNPIQFNYVTTTPIVTTIDKSLVPAILTQSTNTFTFGEAVAPYKVTIQAPVNKIADFETRIAQLEKVITSTSNLSILGNYAEDEYNKEINQL